MALDTYDAADCTPCARTYEFLVPSFSSAARINKKKHITQRESCHVNLLVNSSSFWSKALGAMLHSIGFTCNLVRSKKPASPRGDPTK